MDTQRWTFLLAVAGPGEREVETAGDQTGPAERSQQELVVQRQSALAVDPDAVARDHLGNDGPVPRLETRL